MNEVKGPCCPPAPLIESAVGEDRHGEICYTFILHTADGTRTMDIQYSTGYSEGWDVLELHCMRCGKAVDPEILFGPDKVYRPARAHE